MAMQLALDLKLRSSFSFDNFVTGDNQLLLDMLQQAATGEGEKQLYIWGPEHSGKTHLMQAVCQQAHRAQLKLTYLPMQQLKDYPAEIIKEYARMDLLCIDELEFIENQPQWQESLFHLINLMRAEGHVLVFAGRKPPAELSLQLEDLRSRLNWGPVVKIQPLNDEQKKVLLQQHALNRGMELSDKVASFIMNNYSRDLHHLFEVLQTLDKSSLEHQRKISIPFVKEILG